MLLAMLLIDCHDLFVGFVFDWLMLNPDSMGVNIFSCPKFA